MDSREVMEIFRRTGAYLEGHFLFTSGRHGSNYMQCAKVLQYPEYTIEFGREIADYFRDRGVDTVIGPAMGGVVIAYEVARQLGAKALFAEREKGVMTLRRELKINPGEKVLVVEDVITTGGSVREVIDIVEKSRGELVGVGVIVDRTGGKIDFGVPLKAVLSIELISYPPEECPICRTNLPLVKPGSRNLAP